MVKMVLLRKHIGTENGIYIFNPSVEDDCEDYNASLLDVNFSVEDKHFWFLIRKEKIQKERKGLKYRIISLRSLRQL